MSYVPPHKRRLGKAGQGATANATASNTNTTSASNSNSNKSENITASTATNAAAVVLTTNNNNSTTAANKLLFCEAFSFIRCINLKNRPEQYDKFVYHVQCRIGSEFVNKLKRFDAVNGKEIGMASSASSSSSSSSIDFVDDVALEWDTTTNSLWDRHVSPGLIRQMTPGEIGCALSHISLWKELVTMVDDKEEQEQEQEQQVEQRSRSMLIFEDDVAFLSNGGQQRKDRRDNNANNNDNANANANANVDDRFIRAFEKAWKILPKDWDIFYLGFSDRGERKELIDSSLSSSSSSSSLNDNCDDDDNEDDLFVQIFKPTYGFHTHAYAIRKSAAKKLLHNLPAVGPIDVWLADNQWFGLNVYCSIVANEGYKNTGSPLVYQDRSMIVTGKGKSSVGQSGR